MIYAMGASLKSMHVSHYKNSKNKKAVTESGL
jgi:hypothetical protein